MNSMWMSPAFSSLQYSWGKERVPFQNKNKMWIRNQAVLYEPPPPQAIFSPLESAVVKAENNAKIPHYFYADPDPCTWWTRIYCSQIIRRVLDDCWYFIDIMTKIKQLTSLKTLPIMVNFGLLQYVIGSGLDLHSGKDAAVKFDSDLDFILHKNPSLPHGFYLSFFTFILRWQQSRCFPNNPPHETNHQDRWAVFRIRYFLKY